MAFGKEVAVNIADVERFRQSVNHFSLQTSSSLRKMEETLKFMIDHSKRRAQELKTLAQRFEGLRPRINSEENKTRGKLRAAEQRLRSIPKEIEEQLEDGTVVKRSNPEADALQSEIDQLNSKLGQLESLKGKVERETQNVLHSAGRVEQIMGQLRNLCDRLSNARVGISQKSESAQLSLQRTITTINNYLLYQFHI